MSNDDIKYDPSEPLEQAPKFALGEAETSLIKELPLRQKTRDFIRFYTEIGADHYGNGTQCAILAGYTKRSASSTAAEILTRPSVKKAIELANEERAKAFDWDFERWTKELISIFEALTPTHPNKLKAIELIGKSKGFIRDNQIQLNTINVIGDQDIAKIRGSIADKMTKRLTANGMPISTVIQQVDNGSGVIGV